MRTDNRFKMKVEDVQGERSLEKQEIFIDLALQIAEIRQKKGMSQKQLAKHLKITEEAVGKLEDTNNKEIPLDLLIKLADVLHKKLKIELV